MKRLCNTRPLAIIAPALIATISMIAPSNSLEAQNAVSEAQSLEQLRTQVKEYTELQRILAQANSEWEVDQSFVNDSIELLAIELQSIEASLEKFKDTGTKTQEKIGTLEDRKEELLAAADRVTEAIMKLETKVKELALRFPPPLKESVAPLMRRIPEDPKSPKAPPIGQRLQNIVGILSVAEKFNTSLHSFGEIQTIDGKEQQVATIYLGLAASFSINADADVATVGHPTADGWAQTSQPELAPAIKRFLESFDGVREPEFVPLQVEIR